MKKYNKLKIAKFIFNIRITSAINSYLYGKYPIVLCLHRVFRDDTPINIPIFDTTYLTVKNFDAMMGYIKHNYQFMDDKEFFQAYMGKKKLSVRSFLLTFDDGWMDSYINGYPIIRKYNAPAMFFLSTGFIGSDRTTWHSEVAYIIFEIFSEGERISEFYKLLERFGVQIRKMDREEFSKLLVNSDYTKIKNWVEDIIEILKEMENDNLYNLILKIKDFYGRPLITPQREFMGWDEVSEMVNYGITIGAHTHNHPILTKVSDEEKNREIIISKEILEQKLGRPVELFAYPNGIYNQTVAESVCRLGFTAAFSVGYSGSFQRKNNQYAIPRIFINEDKITDECGNFSKYLFEYNTNYFVTSIIMKIKRIFDFS